MVIAPPGLVFNVPGGGLSPEEAPSKVRVALTVTGSPAASVGVTGASFQGLSLEPVTVGGTCAASFLHSCSLPDLLHRTHRRLFRLRTAPQADAM